MRRFVAVVAAAVLVLSGCTGARPGPPPEPEATGPARGGRLRVAVVGAGSLDPAQARTVDQLLVADQLFDGLTAADPATGRPVPALAATWSVTPDQRLWEFTLRPDATFSNGRQITAADVKYSLERVARKGSGSPAADLLEPVAGFRPFAVEGSQDQLLGIQGGDVPTVVRIQLDQPFAALPALLANPSFGIVARESVEAQPPAPAFTDQPVTSGPFQIARRTADVISLSPAPGVETYVAGMDLVLVENAEDGYEAFTARRVDYATVPPDRIDEAGRRYGRDAFRPYVAELFYGFNLRNPVFADLRFREAIVRAVDRRSIATAIYGNTVLPLDSVVLEGVPGHQDDACAPRCVHDLEQARALVREVFPDGAVPEVQIDYDADATQEAIAKALEANLEEAGIPAGLRPKPLREYQDFAVSGEQQLFRLGWIGPYLSPDAFLPPLFASTSPSNLTGFKVPEVDQQLLAARAEPDPDRRLGLYQAAEKAIFEWVPILPIAQFKVHGVVSSRVRDLEPTVTGTFDATKVWLAPRR